MTGNNDCGLGGQPNTNHTYGGKAGVAPNVDATTCGTNDGFSVTGWGRDTAALAGTCTWTDHSQPRPTVLRSDTFIGYNWPWRDGRTACNNQLDLHSTITHERGHSFGLGHPPSGHNGLTMVSRLLQPATTDARPG